MKAKRFAISVMSRDRPGIVSNVTGAILELEGNIDKLTQTVMDGFFTILLIVSFERPRAADEVRQRIADHGRQLELAVSIKPYSRPQRRAQASENIHILTVMGRDQRGVIHEIADLLAARGVNIVDLYYFLRRPGEFVMISEIEAPPDQDVAQLQLELEERGARHELSVRLQHQDVFQATNSLYLTRQEEV